MLISSKYTHSITRDVLGYIQDNPGCTRRDILTALPLDVKRASVSSILIHLSHAKAIENRGGSGLAARWFPVAEADVDGSYLVIAGELIDEMAEIHHSRREEYLAKRLQEIFGE